MWLDKIESLGIVFAIEALLFIEQIFFCYSKLTKFLKKVTQTFYDNFEINNKKSNINTKNIIFKKILCQI